MPVSQPKEDALVLVVCANYNHADWLEGGVGSLLNQTFKRWRLMLVDDRSTHHSLDKLKALAQTDERIQVIQLKENSGASTLTTSRRKIGWHMCSGSWGRIPVW